MANIGKNAIENLTIGMYENDNIIFREYIQNSADSIDKAIQQGLITKEEAEIEIYIDNKNKTISIHDNALGVSVDDFERKLKSIADSDKNRNEDKGFRGIGRLGGLAYCDKLIFTSSFKGENIKSTMTWDATLLRTVLNDSNERISASDLVEQVTSFEQETCAEHLHFFEVKLIGVLQENEDLLNEEKVCEYLECVAPVQYKSTFNLQKFIYEYATNNNFKIDEYKIRVNRTYLFKPYSVNIYNSKKNGKKNVKNEKIDKIERLEFVKILSKNGEVLAWMWYGISNFNGVIDKVNEMRGIRIRKENIQIGDSNTLVTNNYFKESRGNNYFIGEIFALSKDLVPNARRDYFNSNMTCRVFEEGVKLTTYNELKKLYEFASKTRSAHKKIEVYNKKVSDFENSVAEGKFVDEKDKSKASHELEELEKKKNIGENDLKKLKEQSNNNDTFKSIISTYKNIPNIDVVVDIVDKKHSTETEVKKNNSNITKEVTVSEKPKYITDKLVNLSNSEKQIVGKIYNIIKDVLPFEQSEELITKIQEELKK